MVIHLDVVVDYLSELVCVVYYDTWNHLHMQLVPTASGLSSDCETIIGICVAMHLREINLRFQYVLKRV